MRARDTHSLPLKLYLGQTINGFRLLPDTNQLNPDGKFLTLDPATLECPRLADLLRADAENIWQFDRSKYATEMVLTHISDFHDLDDSLLDGFKGSTKLTRKLNAEIFFSITLLARKHLRHRPPNCIERAIRYAHRAVDVANVLLRCSESTYRDDHSHSWLKTARIYRARNLSLFRLWSFVAPLQDHSYYLPVSHDAKERCCRRYGWDPSSGLSGCTGVSPCGVLYEHLPIATRSISASAMEPVHTSPGCWLEDSWRYSSATSFFFIGQKIEQEKMVHGVERD